MQIYWFSVFPIPSGVSHDLEAIFRSFLWAQGDDPRGRCRVTWSIVCKPLMQGGLGIRRVSSWNRALFSKHLWDLISNRNSLWVRWVKAVRFNHDNIWKTRSRPKWSWILRKLLDLRPHIRRYVIRTIGDGGDTHAWEDNWITNDYLGNHISYRMVYAENLHKDSSVRDVVTLFQGSWPRTWIERYPLLSNLQLPTLIPGGCDKVSWLNHVGKKVDFSVKEAWRAFEGLEYRSRWCRAVWFPGFIPRHSFCLWLAFQKKLPTQDRILIWNREPPDFLCALCDQVMDSHNHLFFECSFAKEVWQAIKGFAALEHFGDNWDSILLGIQNGSSFPMLLMQKLAIGACVYYVWQERNRRCFQSKRRSVAEVVKIISEVVLNRLAWKFQVKMKSNLR